MSHRTTIKTVLRGVALGVATLPLAIAVFGASDTKGLVSLSLQGVGNGIVASSSCVNPQIVCKTGDTCACLTSTSSLVGNQGFKGGNFALQLSIDTTAPSDLPIGNAGSCSPATGNGILSSSNAKQSVIMKISGLECPSISAGSPDSLI